MDEEIKLRAGLDTTEFDRAAGSMRGRLGQLGEHGNRSFIHASNGAKEFKKALHEVTDQSGVMGTALKFALSPVGGFLTAITLGFEFLNRKIEESNRNLDSMERLGAKPVGNTANALRDAKHAVEDFNLEFNKWLRTRSEHDKITEQLKEQLDLLQLQSKEAEKLAKTGAAGPSADALEKKRLQLEFALQSKALFAVSGEIGKAGTEVETWQRVNKTKKGETKIARAQANVGADTEMIGELEKQFGIKKTESQDTNGVLWDALKGIFGAGPGASQLASERVDELNSLQKQIKAAKKRIEENNEVIAKETQARKAAADRLSESQGQLDKLHGAYDSLSKSLETTRQALSIFPAIGSDLRNPAQKSVDEAVAGSASAQQQYMDSVNKRQQAWMNRLTPFANQVKPITPETQMKSMDDQLKEINKTLTNGIPVFGKE